jgi:hypothetical protein
LNRDLLVAVLAAVAAKHAMEERTRFRLGNLNGNGTQSSDNQSQSAKSKATSQHLFPFDP